MTMLRRPRLSDEHRQQLVHQDGLTPAQLMYLDRALTNVAAELQRSAALIDLRDELCAVHKAVSDAASRVQRWKRARPPLPGAEALGKLDMADAQMG